MAKSQSRGGGKGDDFAMLSADEHGRRPHGIRAGLGSSPQGSQSVELYSAACAMRAPPPGSGLAVAFGELQPKTLSLVAFYVDSMIAERTIGDARFVAQLIALGL
jgi:hypothetical protein